jgi:aryl-alcohol dehydrogenase-like predicted oxidoreductase
MQKRKMGYSDLTLTTVGLGTWAMGGGDWKFSWGPQDDRESIAAIHRAIELGVNWLDTAAVYGLGHSEEMVARALAGMKEKPLIATKCSRVWDGQGNIGSNLSREGIFRECEDSLRRLQVEVIDLYQVHWPLPDEQIEEGWGAMAELVKAGKVRYAGVSNFNVAQLKRIQPIHPVASLQPPYSMLRRDIEAELLPYCQQNQIGVIVYSPMQKGLLTGKVTREWVASLPEDDHRKRDPMFNEPRLSDILGLVEFLRGIAQKHGRSLAELSIAWTLRRPELTSAIVGARRPEQIEGTAPAGDWEIPEEDLRAIEARLTG